MLRLPGLPCWSWRCAKHSLPGLSRRPCCLPGLLRRGSRRQSLPPRSSKSVYPVFFPCRHSVTLQRWNSRFFESTTLQSLSLVVQLGHHHKERCPVPALAPRSFVVIHTNGFHPLTVQFCECDNQAAAGTRVQQLLRYELYPATLDDPSTCCTFRLMETFHLLTLQSKVTVYDFYVSLQKMTDRFALSKPFVSSRALLAAHVANLQCTRNVSSRSSV